MSDQAIINQNGDTNAEIMLRQELTKLDVKKKTIEHEADAIYLELTTPSEEGIQPMGIDTPLVDQDGYPRADIDIYRTRILRRRFRELKTDHKEVTQKIEAMLIQLAALKKPHIKEEEKKEQYSRKAPKPKPKYDPVTGKWVVMNWDGTVSGIPGGENRLFEEIDRQMSGLTGDDDVSSLGSSVINSTRSTTTADHEPQPPSMTVQDSNGDPKQPFARVDAVAKDSPAQSAGIKEEDLIVTFGPLHADNHDHLKVIAELVTEAAAEQKNIDICILRRVQRSDNNDTTTNNQDKWETVHLTINPRPWNGRGFLGCHIVPYLR